MFYAIISQKSPITGKDERQTRLLKATTKAEALTEINMRLADEYAGIEAGYEPYLVSLEEFQNDKEETRRIFHDLVADMVTKYGKDFTANQLMYETLLLNR